MPFRRESPSSAGPSSERVRQALDALLSDTPIAGADLTALSESEREELAALTRTSHLTRIVLHADAPGSGAEAEALGRAQTALMNRKPGSAVSGAQQRDSRSTTSWLGSLLDRLRDPNGDRR